MTTNTTKHKYRNPISPLDKMRLKWNYAARRFYESERRSMSRGRPWSVYDSLDEKTKDYYRGRAQQEQQDSQPYYR